ncbi:MAG: Stk1 family PASTA domain-containing Ser/Thr kinase [Actinomycetota bacterium]|nr:Stk1 family PASTA domain-containing Ser/Thr kinase [Actinomycetota bacterium]
MTTPGGPLLGGRYEVGAAIGQGGMADVFLGRDVRLGRDVAIKVLRADLSRELSFQGRFRREAQAAASLNAPHVVSVYDTGEDAAGVPYIVMEYVEGRTLREVLHTEGRLLPQRALEVAADICSALDAAHAAGIVHRDIKPANVMLTSAGEIKVMDFGIARAVADASSTVTQTASVIGTAAYLSPEQARGEHVDARSDIYSTGCLLYELVTGAPPFVGESPVAVAYQHVREDPTPPSAYDETLPAAVDAVVLKAMAKNPANRYQSTAEMRDDLLRAAAGRPVAATPVLGGPVLPAPPVAALGPLRSPEGARARRRVIYGVFSALLVAVVAIVALLVHNVLGTSSGGVLAPALVGLSQQDATVKLATVGLQVGVVTFAFDPSPVGTVFRQSPEQGILTSAGGKVDLYVSKGIEMTVVPQVIGLSQLEATAQLEAAKLTIQKVIPRDVNLPAGQVLDVLPRPGVTVRAGSTVDIVVSSGLVQVPNVLGKAKDAAISILQQAGFNVGLSFRDNADPAGVVLDEKPINTTAPRGSAVVLTVSQTPASPTPAPSSTDSAGPTPTGTDTPTASPSP